MPKGPRRRRGSISIKVSGICISCGGTRSCQYHPAPQEWSDFYHCSDNVTLSSKKSTMRLCHGCYGLFAERDYKKGEFVAEYGGRLLSLDEIEGKDQSYFRVLGVSKHNGVIDGKHDFGDTLGRYINMPMKGKHPNVRWEKVNEKKKTITIKTNKDVIRGTEFTIKYSPPMRVALQAKRKRGRPPGQKKTITN